MHHVFLTQLTECTDEMDGRGLSERMGMATSLPVMMGEDFAGALPRISEDNEVQKMLADEKMRSDQHKNNYQTLKVEHTR